jgi:hypothetical protein
VLLVAGRHEVRPLPDGMDESGREATFVIGSDDFPIGYTDVSCAKLAVLLQTYAT